MTDPLVPAGGITCEYGERVPSDWRRQEAKGGERDSTQLRGAVTDGGPTAAHFPHVTDSSQLPGSEAAGGTARAELW